MQWVLERYRLVLARLVKAQSTSFRQGNLSTLHEGEDPFLAMALALDLPGPSAGGEWPEASGGSSCAAGLGLGGLGRVGAYSEV